MPAAAKKPPQDDRKKLASSEPSADRGSVARAEPEGATGITGNKWPIVDPSHPAPACQGRVAGDGPDRLRGCAGDLAGGRWPRSETRVAGHRENQKGAFRVRDDAPAQLRKAASSRSPL